MSNGQHALARPSALSPTGGPLTASHYDQILAAERTIHDLLPQIDKAETCNVPGCAQLRENLRHWASQLSNLKQSYFPNGRPA
jgi:hypothetical protein